MNAFKILTIAGSALCLVASVVSIIGLWRRTDVPVATLTVLMVGALLLSVIAVAVRLL